MMTYLSAISSWTSRLIILFLFSTCTIVQAQDADHLRKAKIHDERAKSEYIPVNKDLMDRSPAYRDSSSDIFTNQVNVDSNGDNIVGDAANEPSIAVDPTDPNNIVIGWRQFDTINDSFRQAGYSYSSDGGETWTASVIDPGVFRSDPVLDFDAQGNFYYNSLTIDGGFACDVSKSEDGGATWSVPTPAQGGDKQWMRIDRTSGIGFGNIYTNWNPSFSICDLPFTRSTDGNVSYEPCSIIPDDPKWGTLAIDADGTLYVIGRDNSFNMILAKSFNAQDANEEVVWSQTQVDLDGELNVGLSINPQGLIGQAWVDTDISNGAGHGNVYVLASVRRDSNSDEADVMFIRSEDGGNTFSTPLKINDDDATEDLQWFGTMAVAPNGRIDVIWLDTREDQTNHMLSALYYSFSKDQGNTWSPNEKMSDTFDSTIGWPQQNKMGDYFDMVSDNNGAHVAWANTINGGQDVYYSFITPELIISTGGLGSTEDLSLLVYPNPIESISRIELNATNETVWIELFNVLSQKKQTIYEGYVSNSFETELDVSKLESGIYVITAKTASQILLKKIVIH